MALSAAAKRKMSRSDIVAWHLRRMARKADPDNGYLTAVAELIDVHPTTISDWIAQGYIPMFQVKKLHKRFGKLAPEADLVQQDSRTQGASA